MILRNADSITQFSNLTNVGLRRVIEPGAGSKHPMSVQHAGVGLQQQSKLHTAQMGSLSPAAFNKASDRYYCSRRLIHDSVIAKAFPCARYQIDKDMVEKKKLSLMTTLVLESQVWMDKALGLRWVMSPSSLASTQRRNDCPTHWHRLLALRMCHSRVLLVLRIH